MLSEGDEDAEFDESHAGMSYDRDDAHGSRVDEDEDDRDDELIVSALGPPTQHGTKLC